MFTIMPNHRSNLGYQFTNDFCRHIITVLKCYTFWNTCSRFKRNLALNRNSNIFRDSSLIRETEIVANFKGKSLLQHLTQMGTLIKSPTKYFTVGYENTRNFRKNMSLDQDFLLHYKD